MKLALSVIFALTIAGSSGAQNSIEDSEFDPKNYVRDKIVLILGSYTDFHDARKRALLISRASKTPFSTQDMIYDKKRGLILPDDYPDGTYAGSYVHRRYNTARLSGTERQSEYISIERSDAYPGFAPRYDIIIGGIYDDPKEAKTALFSRYKPVVADAYAKKTKIYMGCIH